MAREITVTFTADVDSEQAAHDFVERVRYDASTVGARDLTYVSSKAPEPKVAVAQSEYDEFVAWRDSK